LKPRRRSAHENLARLGTERPNRASAALDQESALEIARLINAEDAKVARAVRRALPQIARAIDWIADSLRRGGRLIYVGTGTSGRLGALDAAECPPTFHTDPKTVQFIMAGGPKALGAAVEADEDSLEFGEREMAKKKPGKKDVVVGLAASGRTPFTIAALACARRRGARTVAVACNHNSPLEKVAHLAIVTVTGPEVVAKWIQQFGQGEPDEFIESIPYTETRFYVKKVLRTYREYKRIYAAECRARFLDKAC